MLYGRGLFSRVPLWSCVWRSSLPKGTLVTLRLFALLGLCVGYPFSLRSASSVADWQGYPCDLRFSNQLRASKPLRPYLTDLIALMLLYVFALTQSLPDAQQSCLPTTAPRSIFKRPPAGAAARRFLAIFIKFGLFLIWSKSGFGVVLG